MNQLHNSYHFESRSFLFLTDEKHAQKNVINPDGLTTVRMPVIPTSRLLFVMYMRRFFAYYRGLDRIRILFSRGLKLDGRKISRNSNRSGYYFRGRKISRKIKIREYSENFLHAKNWCYTVFNSATFICRHIACINVAELNTPSDENGITGVPSAVFFNEMGNKKEKKWEIKKKGNKKKKKVTQIDRSCTRSHFSNANLRNF